MANNREHRLAMIDQSKRKVEHRPTGDVDNHRAGAVIRHAIAAGLASAKAIIGERRAGVNLRRSITDGKIHTRERTIAVKHELADRIQQLRRSKRVKRPRRL
jgi:hypothetical protein